MEKCRERLGARHAAAKTFDLNRQWLISPAWRYAMMTIDLLEEERLRTLKKDIELIDNV